MSEQKFRDLITQNISPDATAMIYADKMITYKKLLERIDFEVNYLSNQGIQFGDIVGISLPHYPRNLILTLALFEIGAASVVLHPNKSKQERSEIAKKYNVKTVITFDDSFALDGIGLINITSKTQQSILPSKNKKKVTSSTPLKLFLSSGTSGKIKAVMLSQEEILNRINSSQVSFSASTRLLPFDLNFAMGLIFSINVLKEGGTIVFPAIKNPNLINAIHYYGINEVILSPLQASRLVDQLEGTNSLPSVNRVIITGDDCPFGLINSLKNKVTHNIYNNYGLSEVGGISSTTPENLPLKEGELAKGNINQAITVEIVDENDNILTAMQSGRIRVKSKKMPKGYYLDEEITSDSFKNGYFYTSDKGFISEDGFLCLEGRIDDLINIGGVIIEPTKIERTVNQNTNIKESIAFAVKNSLGVNQLALAIVVADESNKKDIELF